MKETFSKLIESTLIWAGIGIAIVGFAFANKYNEYETTATLAGIGIVMFFVGIMLKVIGNGRRKNQSLKEKTFQSFNNNVQIVRCSHCGLELSPETAVCPNCGSKVELTPQNNDITALVTAAEKGGTRTASAVRTNGDMVQIQSDINNYLRSRAYTRSQLPNGESVWLKREVNLIKVEYVEGYVVLSGSMRMDGEESNLEGTFGLVAKRETLTDMAEIKRLIDSSRLREQLQSIEEVACPSCGAVQKNNREICYKCGAKIK